MLAVKISLIVACAACTVYAGAQMLLGPLPWYINAFFVGFQPLGCMGFFKLIKRAAEREALRYRARYDATASSANTLQSRAIGRAYPGD